jgi:Cysteine rich repeat
MKTFRLSGAALAIVAAIAFGAPPHSAGAQPSAAQQNAMRQHCRSDFKAHCAGVTPGGKDAVACLQKHVTRLSGACQKVVRATLADAPSAKMAAPAVAAATAPPPPPPSPPAAAKLVPIKSVAPPPARPARQRLRHPAAIAVAAPPPATHAAAAPPPPPPAKHIAVAVPPPPLPPPPTHAAPPKKRTAAHVTVPPSHAHPARNPAVSAAAMERACRFDLARHCGRVRPGGGREFACLAAHGRSLTARCHTALQVSSRTR